jgi:hypothetical protein
MTSFLPGVAFIAALTIAAPVWAQGPMTAEDLNRQELYRLATTTTPPVAGVPAFVPDTVGLIVADGIRPEPPSLLLGVGNALATGFWGNY